MDGWQIPAKLLRPEIILCWNEQLHPKLCPFLRGSPHPMTGQCPQREGHSSGPSQFQRLFQNLQRPTCDRLTAKLLCSILLLYTPTVVDPRMPSKNFLHASHHHRLPHWKPSLWQLMGGVVQESRCSIWVTHQLSRNKDPHHEWLVEYG